MSNNDEMNDQFPFPPGSESEFEGYIGSEFKDLGEMIAFLQLGIKALKKGGRGGPVSLTRKEIDVVFEDTEPRRPRLRYPDERPDVVEVVLPKNGSKTKTIGKRRQGSLVMYSGIIPNNEFTIALRIGMAAKRMGIDPDSHQAKQQIKNIHWEQE